MNRSWVAKLGVVLLSVGAALAIRLSLNPFNANQTPFLVFFAAVMVSASYGGLWPGLLATLLSDLLVDYFFLPPVHVLFTGSITENLPLLVFAIEGTGMSTLAEFMRMARQRSESDRKLLREFANRLASTEEQTRRRVSEQIHDTVVQTLSMANIRLDTIRSQTADAGPSDSHRLDECSELIETGLDECRSLMAELTPPQLYDLGLGAALKFFAESQRQHAVAITVDKDSALAPLTKSQRGFLFYAAREAIVNAMKHAGPCDIRVSLSQVEEDLLLIVSDNGCGAIPNAFARAGKDLRKGGFGLFNIRERLRGMRGRVDIESEPSKGTTVTIRMPLIAHPNQ